MCSCVAAFTTRQTSVTTSPALTSPDTAQNADTFTMVLVGGCICGAVRFETQVDDPQVAVCHCHPCRLRHSLNIMMPRSGLKFTKGEESLKTYTRVADSGKNYHHRFCGEYGVDIVGLPDAVLDMLSLKAGVLDDPQTNFAKIAMEVYTTSRRSYLEPMQGAAQYEYMLPM